MLLTHRRWAFAAVIGIAPARLALPAQTVAARPAAPIAARARVAARRQAAGELIRVDGSLDEPAWLATPVASDFRQREPLEGEPASEATEVRILYDASTLYIGVSAHDREPDKVIARILQRDRVMGADFEGKPRFGGDDAVAILLDPFDDHRNGFVFATNANGAEFDALVTDEGRQFNVDWRGVWRVAARRTSDGWSAEFAIPFRTLRYPRDPSTWGINVYRIIRRKNEEVLWQGWSRDGGGFQRVSLAGHLTGLGGLPRAAYNLEVKPYLLAGGDQYRAEGTIPTVQSARGAVGVDLKTEVRPGLVLDATLNTDFAQVEADNEQVNLTRFSLFFPEKREFFLENAGIFEFGTKSAFEPPPFLLFFSRRIGVSDSGAVPVLGGARMTGRVGDQTVGFLDIVTDRTPFQQRTNFGVLRVKRDVASGYVGAMLIDRRTADSANTAGGLDFSMYPTQALNVQGFVARTGSRTSTSGVGDGTWRLGADYQTGRLGVTTSYLVVGPDVDAQAGFVSRTDIRRSDLMTRLTFRPEVLGLRALSIGTFTQHVARTDGFTQDWSTGISLDQTWQSGDHLSLFPSVGRTRFADAFNLADSVLVPGGDYVNSSIGFFATTSAARAISLNVFSERQWVYDGVVSFVNTTLSIAAGSRVLLSVQHSRSWAELPRGALTVDLVSAKAGVAFSTHLFLNSLVQYNTLDRNVSSNVRLAYTYAPGSDLFVVLNEDRGSRLEPWRFHNRGVRVKLTYLFQI